MRTVQKSATRFASQALRRAFEGARRAEVDSFIENGNAVNGNELSLVLRICCIRQLKLPKPRGAQRIRFDTSQPAPSICGGLWNPNH
jgi:hypothetical protein